MYDLAGSMLTDEQFCDYFDGPPEIDNYVAILQWRLEKIGSEASRTVLAKFPRLF
jgi:hypothetical protein